MTRERPIPCRGATLQESIRGSHKTWADDGYCTKCRVLAARSIAAVRANHPSSADVGLVSSASRDRSVDGAVSATFARVGVLRTAADAGTFDAGFLSEAAASGGGSMTSQRLADFGRPRHPHT